MKKFVCIFTCLLLALGLQMRADSSYEIVTSSNDPNGNKLLVYDASGKLLQSESTNGKGGVLPHSVGGGIAKTDALLAVCNYNSQSISIFKHHQGVFKLIQVVPVQSKPVSLTFGKGHLYILGETTIESHLIKSNFVEKNADGSAQLLVGDGSAAQVGLLPNELIVSERSNMIELVTLKKGVVTDTIHPVELPPPPKNDTPVGLVTRGDNAYVTIAHSDEVGLVRDGALVKIVSSETQHAPCWLTLMGSWLFCSNTPSKSISRYDVSQGLELSELIAAQTEGEPTDLDAENGILVAIELGKNGAQLTQFEVDNSGNLKQVNSIPTSETPNGIAVIHLVSDYN